MKKFIPFAHAKNVFEIDNEFYLKNNVQTLFLDLDNTLDSYKCRVPSQRSIDLVNRIKEVGIKVYMISNNTKKRINQYADLLGVEYLYKACKPFSGKINKFILEHNIDKEKTMLVGDQLMTDVLLGHHAKIRVVLTEKIVKEDQPTTKFNRLIDVPIRKRMARKNLLIDWRDK